MTFRPAALALTGWALGALACGSRSGLLGVERDAGPEAGALGGASSGGASFGGTAGTAPCLALSKTPVVLTPDDVPVPPRDDNLRLTASSEDGEQVTAAFLRSGSGDSYSVRHATLRPWGAWPSGTGGLAPLGPLHSAQISTVSSHRVARSKGETWAVVTRAGGGPALARFLPTSVDGNAGDSIALSGIEPMFVAENASVSAHLVGAFDTQGSGSLLRITIVDSDGGVKDLPALGCANGQPLRADAVAFDEGWLVASRAAPAWVSAPDRRHRHRRSSTSYAASSGQLTVLSSFTTGATVLDVAAARSKLGIFVVWSTAVTAPGQTPEILAERVSGADGGSLGPVSIASGEFGSFAVGSIGSDLVVARRLGLGALAFRLLDEGLGPVADLAFEVGPNLGPSSVYGSPNGRGAVVGFTSLVDGGFRVRLARIDCAP
ncbi:MAG: hypothetical protein U0263_25935 [Polyangiaceae bacterium]